MSCGINVILVRGLGRESEHWFNFSELLNSRCKEIAPYVHFNFLTPDIAGCGTEFQRRTPNSIAAIADDLITRLPKKTKDACTVFVGLSMGGMIAMDLASRYPQSVDGLVLINTSGAGQRTWQRLKPGAALLALAALLAPWRQRERWMFDLVSNSRPPSLRDHWLEIQKRRPVSRRNLVNMLIAAAGYRESDNPVKKGLVIASSSDRMVNCRCSSVLAKKYRWPLELNAIAGHDIPLDSPAWLANVIAQWLVREHVL